MGDIDLADFHPHALAAAMRGGTQGWGQHGNAMTNVRYIQPIVGRRGRVKCGCGCGKRSTHLGMANGVCMSAGCELQMRRWVRDPREAWKLSSRA